MNRTVFGLPSGFGVLLREVPAAENDIPYRVLAGTPYYLAVDLQRLTDVGAVTVANPFRNVSDGTAVRPILRAFRVLAEELAILAELDYRTGQVLDAIDAAGVADNTIVVWSSDNPVAPAMAGSNGPWRGNFASGSEGGMRAPAMVRWPGKVAVGRVTDEILSAVDWLPTLAGLVGERDRVPTDRPIDGVDASAFLLGQSPTTGRDHILYFGSESELMSVKWRTMKVVFRYAETFSGPIIKPQIPMMFDLIDDPGEQREMFTTRMDCGWVLLPVLERLGAFQQSVARYPNIKPGQDFRGYT